jgi:hypothetical protein
MGDHRSQTRLLREHRTLLRQMIRTGLENGQWKFRRSIAPALNRALSRSSPRTTRHQVDALIRTAEAQGQWPVGWADAQLSKQCKLYVARGTASRQSTLTEDDVRAIRSAYSLRHGVVTRLAQQFHISTIHVHRIRRRQQWRHLP